MSLILRKFLLAGVLLAVAMPAAADTLVLQDVDDMDDTYLWTGDTSVNQGANVGMQIGNKTWICHGLMRFDLSAIPTGSTINSASLVLSTQTARVEGVDLTFHYITADWDENGVTWTIRKDPTPGTPGDETLWTTAGGDYNSTAALTFTDLPARGAWEVPHETLDITSMVQAWVSGTQTNYGLLVRFEVEGSGDDQNFWWAASEQHSGEEPILTIDYTIVPEPATMSLLGLGGLGLLIRRKRK